MNSLVNRANKQASNIKNDLSSLREALETKTSTMTTSLCSKTITKPFPFLIYIFFPLGQLSASLSGLQGTIRDLETMTRNETDPAKREEYKE